MISGGDDARWFGDSTVGDRFPAWTRGNAADVFPDPFSPLGQTMVVRGGMCPGLRDGYIDIGVMDYDEFEDPARPDLFKMFGGYLYNPLSVTRLLGARMPGVTPELIDQAFFDDHDEVPEYDPQPWHESATHEARLAASMEWAMTTEALPELDADMALARAQRESRPDLSELSDAALIARARSMVPLVQRIFENAIRVSSLSSLGSGGVAATCEAIGQPELAMSLLAGIEVDSAAPSREMWELGRAAAASPSVAAAFDLGVDGLLDRLATEDSAETGAFLDRFEDFLFAYGSRAQNEYDVISPSWEVRPEIALAAIDLMRRSDPSKAPELRNAAVVAERDQVVADVSARLADEPEALAGFEAAMRSARVFLSGRERAKTNVVIVINEIRVALRELGRRLVERGIIDEVEHLFMLTETELDPFRHDPESFTETIAGRWTQYRKLFDLEPVFVVNGRAPLLSDMAERGRSDLEPVAPGTVLSGAAGSGGVATGPARVVLDAADPVALEPGDVLIAPQTDPSWVPLFVPAAAVVINVGAMGSHAMIVSRELGIPCVASVKDATQLIPDGALVTVDGNAGTVTVHQDSAELLAMGFAEASRLDADTRRGSLGGKGAALARMTAMGLPVPPGFTLTTAACHSYLRDGWGDALDEAVEQGLAELEAETGKALGDPARPLLLSVRSGAPVSMPGMMDTVLNAGMTGEVARALGAATDDAWFGWDTARRFVQSYVTVVQGAPDDLVRELALQCLGADEGRGLDAESLAEAVDRFKLALANDGYGVPDDPHEQVRSAAQAVFGSWNSERARVYREIEGIDDALGTAATIQMMAFGNLGDRSGTGVAFSRDPSTGEPGVMGDFLQGAQGEDVVAGTHETLPIDALGELWPEVADELDRTASLLERDLGDLADIEFTVEEGVFWLLQVRKGKHSPQAALRMAIDMAEEPDFPLTRADALERVAPVLADPPMMATGTTGPDHGDILSVGLAASPGRAAGILCTDVDAAIAAEAHGRAVILARRETSPADIAGMAASRGIVTSRGGLVSHAAVVARGWGLPAVVGASAIEVADDGIRVGERFVAVGTEITIDGSTGEVLLGSHQADEVEVPEVATLRAWQRQSNSSAPVADSGGHAEEVSDATVGRVLAIKGMGDAMLLAAVLGAPVGQVETVLAGLVERNEAQELPGGRVRPTPGLTSRVDDHFAEAATRLAASIEPHMDAFHDVNMAFKELVTDWQIRTIDGEQVPNDHQDAAYDAAVIGRLRTDIHAAIAPIIAAISEHEARFTRYGHRLETALSAVEAGDADMFAHPVKDSYHTVWFELHEELIRLTGRNRADEAAAGRA